MSEKESTPSPGRKDELHSLLMEREVLQLLHTALDAGAASARIVATGGEVLWQAAGGEPGDLQLVFPIIVAGESVGHLELRGRKGRRRELQPIAAVLALSLSTLIGRSPAPAERGPADQPAEGEASRLKAEVAANQARIDALGSEMQVLQTYLGRFCSMLHFYRDYLELGLPREVLVNAADLKWRELKLSQVVAELERSTGRRLTRSDPHASPRLPNPAAQAKRTA